MAIKLPPKRYYTFAEVQLRWQCTENDIRELILTRALVPSVLVNGSICPLTPGSDDEGGAMLEPTRDQNADRLMVSTREFYFLPYWNMTAPFSGDTHVISTSREHQGTPEGLYLVEKKDGSDHLFSIDDVLRDGVVMAEELDLVEDNLRPAEPQVQVEKPLSTTERNTLLVLTGLLAKMANLDITKASAAGTTLESKATEMGLSLSKRSAEDHLRRVDAAMQSRTTK